MASSNEAAGLKAISSIRYKIATASTDEKQLSEVLQTQLVPLLDKAGSPLKPIRDAVSVPFVVLVMLRVDANGLFKGVSGLHQRHKAHTATGVCPHLTFRLVLSCRSRSLTKLG
jgi:hypothetical protein